jgi:hypothetical protein
MSERKMTCTIRAMHYQGAAKHMLLDMAFRQPGMTEARAEITMPLERALKLAPWMTFNGIIEYRSHYDGGNQWIVDWDNPLPQ